MAPTLVWLESFEHQFFTSVSYGTNAGVWDTNSNATAITAVTGRFAGTHAMQLAQDGVTATRVGKKVAAGNRTLVESFYFKVSAAPSIASSFWLALSTINGQLKMDTSGHITWNAGSGSDQTSSGTYADGAWHRIDIKFVTSASPFTLDLYIDGVSQTQQVSNATTAADITESRLGSNTTGHTLTIQYADFVRSVTAGDYPIGPHACFPLIPDADGTHNWASTNMGNESGGQASSISTLHNSVDEWPANTTDYIAYTSTSATSTEYAEVTLPDISGTVWGARAVAAIFSGGTAANSATTRVVDGSGTTVLDLYVGDQSDTALRHQASIIPSITTDTALNALKWRVGFPTDSNPAPRWSAFLIDYAGPEPLTVSPGFISSNTQIFAPTVSVGTGPVSPGFITSNTALFAPSVALAVAPGAIASNTALFAPAVKLAVAPGFISDTAVIYTPTIQTTQVYAPFISDTAVIYTPTVQTSKVYAPAIASSTQIFAPSVAQAVSPGFISNPAQLFAPAVSRAVAVGFISNGNTLYAPAVKLAVAVPFIDDTAVIYAPTALTSGSVTPGFISNPATLYAPTVQVSKVYASFISNPATLFAPAVGRTVAVGFITDTAVLYVPAITQQMAAPFIANGYTVYAPVVAITLRITMPFIVQTAQIYVPVVVPPLPPMYDPSIDQRRRSKRVSLSNPRRAVKRKVVR